MHEKRKKMLLFFGNHWFDLLWLKRLTLTESGSCRALNWQMAKRKWSKSDRETVCRNLRTWSSLGRQTNDCSISSQRQMASGLGSTTGAKRPLCSSASHYSAPWLWSCAYQKPGLSLPCLKSSPLVWSHLAHHHCFCYYRSISILRLNGI